MEPFGVDVGYGNLKQVKKGADGKPEPSCTRSIVGSYSEGLSIGAFDRGRPYVEVDGHKYLIGEAALKHSDRHYMEIDKDWITSTAYGALFTHSLAGMKESGGAYVVTGLPVSYFRNDRERVSGVVNKIASRLGLNVMVKVIPQPMGAFFDRLLDDSGRISEVGKEMMSQRVGILDIGYYTTDLITVDGAEIVERQMASIESGVSTALEAVSKDIAQIHGLSIDPHRTELAIRSGKVKVFGKDTDISDIVSPRLKELAAEIESKARTVWHNAADLDMVLLAGGGAEMLRPYWSLYKHSVVLNNAMMANACGYFKYAVRSLGQKG